MINTQAYQKLLNHFNHIQQLSLNDLFIQELNRFDKYNLNLEGLYLDFSKNNINQETLDLLINLAQELDLSSQIKKMYNGELINNTEKRAVLHTALRGSCPNLPLIDGIDINLQINKVLLRLKEFSYKIHEGKHLGYTGKLITDIVNIGIGGSDLGPVLVCQALAPYRKNNLNIHFISSVDGYQIKTILNSLNPETTLFIIASKTFTTEETMTNADTARQWLLAKLGNIQSIKCHFVAVSTNQKAVEAFGINVTNMFEFWDFVGGRYSLWSSIGLSIILYIGFDNFNQLLSGASAMDKHFFETTDYSKNLPVVMALLGIWYTNFYGYQAQVISPYSTRLTRFPAYIQQLEMESNGKGVNKNGQELNYKTCPILWGDSGINGQHAYYQLLHQGTQIVPMDIIVTLSDKYSDAKHNNILVANAFAQAEALMKGKNYLEAKLDLLENKIEKSEVEFLARHKVFKGNRPSNMWLMPEISPYYLGMLIACYEHKTFTQGVIWQINSFDQMGVQLGKELAKTIIQDLAINKISKHDDSTTNLIKIYLNKQMLQ